MVRERKLTQLQSWLEEAFSSGIAELQGFVRGIERDRAAVEAALSLPWSQGQTEGQVNRLKMLKRQMYGRAGFTLLRQRVLHRA
jgi:transposase